MGPSPLLLRSEAELKQDPPASSSRLPALRAASQVSAGTPKSKQGREDVCQLCSGLLRGVPETACPACGWLYHSDCLIGNGCIHPECRIDAPEKDLVVYHGENLPARLAAPGPLGRRSLALAIDLSVALGMMVAFSLPGVLLGLGLPSILSCASVGGALATLMNDVTLNGLFGASLGKRAVGLKTIDAEGAPPGLMRSFARETMFKPFSIMFYGIGIFMALTDEQHRALQDRLAGTYVVEAKPEASGA